MSMRDVWIVITAVAVPLMTTSSAVVLADTLSLRWYVIAPIWFIGHCAAVRAWKRFWNLYQPR